MSLVMELMTSWFTPSVLFVLLNLTIGTIAVTSAFGTKKKKQHEEGEDPQNPRLARAPSLLERVRSLNFSLYTSEDPHLFTESTLQHHHHHQISRAPSFIQRLRSFDFSPFTHEHTENREAYEENVNHHHHHQISRSPSLIQRLKSLNFSHFTPETHQTVENEGKSEEIVDREEVVEDDHHVKRMKSDTGPSSGETVKELPAKMKKSASLKSALGHFDFEEEERECVDKRRPARTRERSEAASFIDGDEEVDAKCDDFINRFKHQLKLQRLDSILRFKEMLGRGASN
ncbi:Protein of unknown function DUF761, plant [Dillenia turbinata]|uniref:DUF4408 domain-containing protein n=1 Tax=Dillenia turbinata TaxID=194707 RepID=A0AAN8VW83_9MAGN